MRRLCFVGVIVLLLLAVAPGARAGGGLPESLEVRFGEGVSAETRWYVHEALEQAWSTFAPHLDDPAGLDALVVVVTNPNDAAAAWAAERGISEDRARRQFTARSSHFAGLATSGLTVIINDNRGDAGATVHELAHLVQHHVAGPSLGPRWLTEGGAEYFDLLVADHWNIDAAAEPPRLANRTIADEWAATSRNCRAELLPQGSETCTWALESLGRLESGGAFNVGGGAVSAYNRARVAFQTLMDRTGVEEYFCYLEETGSGVAVAGCVRIVLRDGRRRVLRLRELLADPDVASYLGVNEHDGVRWFDADRFSELSTGLIAAALARTGRRAARECIAAIGAAIEAAADRSGYRVDVLTRD